MTFSPRLDALPQAQRALWAELADIPHRYVLYGGTALALRFAHRTSADFDFFAHDHLDLASLDSVVRGRLVAAAGHDIEPSAVQVRAPRLD